MHARTHTLSLVDREQARILIKPGDEDGTIHEEQIIAALKAA
jgi:hypothetical protein